MFSSYIIVGNKMTKLFTTTGYCFETVRYFSNMYTCTINDSKNFHMIYSWAKIYRLMKNRVQKININKSIGCSKT